MFVNLYSREVSRRADTPLSGTGFARQRVYIPARVHRLNDGEIFDATPRRDLRLSTHFSFFFLRINPFAVHSVGVTDLSLPFRISFLLWKDQNVPLPTLLHYKEKKFREIARRAAKRKKRTENNIFSFYHRGCLRLIGEKDGFDVYVNVERITLARACVFLRSKSYKVSESVRRDRARARLIADG